MAHMRFEWDFELNSYSYWPSGSDSEHFVESLFLFNCDIGTYFLDFLSHPTGYVWHRFCEKRLSC